jgi:hypothetical protein
LQFDRGNQFVEAFFANADRILSRIQIGRHELAGFVGDEEQWLQQVAAVDLDARADDDCARRVFDGAGKCVCAQRSGDRVDSSSQLTAIKVKRL